MCSLTFQIYSAGILPYTKYNGKVYFLLGRDTDNRWSDFGGRCEPNDRGDFEVTACREFTEESLGSIFSYDHSRKLIKNNKKTIKIKSITPSGNDYYMYLMKINFDNNIRTKFLSTRNFITSIENIDKKYMEKNDVRWISMETLLYTISEERSLLSLRHIFTQTFKNNCNEIIFQTKFDNE